MAQTINIPVKFKITGETEKIIEDRTLRILTDVVNDALRRSRITMKRRINAILTKNMEDSDTFVSLKFGPLNEHFGLTSDMADRAQKGIIRILRESTDIKIEKFRINKTNVTGNFEISILEASLSKFRDAKFGTYKSQSGSKSNAGHIYDIEWMDWLLTRGVDVIWPNYKIRFYQKLQKRSRSGFALMIKTGNTSASWSIPNDYSGTLDDNFITDVIDNSMQQIIVAVQEDILYNIQ